MAEDGSAAFFREKAAELRQIATTAHKSIAEQILRLVEQYEQLAKDAERRRRF
jgi:hypothetical protein